MARHTGKNAVVKSGSNVIGGLVSFSIDEAVGTADLSAAGDAWEEHDTTLKNWSGSITLRLDFAAGENQTLRAGDSITFEGYTEGEASGKTYLSGTATVESHGVSTSFNGESAREYSIKGNGALSVATVGA